MKRMAKLATVSVLSNQPAEVIENTLALVDEAAKLKPDLIVLPEEIDLIGAGPEDAAKVGEPVPGGPIQERFADKAREHNAVSYTHLTLPTILLV